jgi:hypothetical protein
MPHISDALLQTYIDGCCNDARIAEIEAHVEACAECRDRLEDARNAAQRASQLLGVLDPGPVHAPAFEELQARAAAGAGDQEIDREIDKEIETPTKEEVEWAATLAAQQTPPKTSVPLWRRPALAWAATVVMAFGLGWLSRSELGLPADLGAPAGPSSENLGAELPSANEADEAAVRQQERGVADQTDAPPAPQQELAAAAEIDDVQAAAKRGMPSEVTTELALELAPEPTPQPAPTASFVQQEMVQREVGAQISGAPATAGERRVAEEQVAATAPVRENAPAEGEPLYMELNEQPGRAGGFADIGGARGFLVVDRESAELWLSVAPRELPDLELLRVEVGPGVLFDNGLPGRPAVRLVYRARSGQEIALLQQYTGPLGLLEGAEQAQLGALADERADAAAAPARLERSRSSGLGADRKLAADRDALVVGGTLDLPVTERLPDGTNVYRWMDGAGYLLSISGAIEPDLLRGLADVIR